MTNGQSERTPDLVESVTASPDPQIALAAQLVASAQEASPLLADLVRVASVPRKFDASLLRLLIDHQPSDEEFSIAFSTLIALPFVVRRRDGKYRMHDEIRRALLGRFAATAHDRELLRTLNERLADHYEAQHEQARTVADQFDTVDDLLRQVSPDRVIAMRAAVENQLVRPLIEAQHHRNVADPAEAGLSYFRQSFELYESEGRLEVCRLLLRSWRDDIAGVAGDSANSLHDWDMYYQVRLAVAEADGHDAREIASKLVAQPGLDPKIRMQTQALVTGSLMAECRFADALKETTAEIALRDDDDPDPPNRWVVFAQQAEIHRLLSDGEAQAASLSRALEATRAAGNRDSEAAILNRLSAAQAKQGRITDASRHAIQALHIARTLRPPGAATAAQQCAIQLMRSFGSADPRLADLFPTEAVHLTRGHDIHRFVRAETSYVAALRGAGRFERAHEVLDQVDVRLGDQHPLERSAVLLSRGILLDAEGREREAVARNRHTVEEVERRRGGNWSLAAALTNAATTQMHIGDLLDDACSSADRARDLWLAMGHARGVARADVVRAEVSRRRADYAGAKTALGSKPPLEAMGLEDIWYWTAANVAADLDLLDEAVDHMNAVLELTMRTGQLRDAARAAARLVEILLHAGRQDEAAAAAGRLTDLMARLRKLRQYRQKSASKQADEHSGRAVRQLSIASPRPFDAVRSAAQHLDEAQSADPGPCWYSLNQAYAFLRLGDKKSVSKAIEAATAKAAGTTFEEPIASLAAELAAFAWQ